MKAKSVPHILVRMLIILPDTAITVLVLFLAAVICLAVYDIATRFPPSFYTARKILGLHKDCFTQYVCVSKV